MNLKSIIGVAFVNEKQTKRKGMVRKREKKLEELERKRDMKSRIA